MTKDGSPGRLGGWLGTIMLIAGCAVPPVLAADEAVVLMYHRFGESAHPSTNIRLEQFEAHLEYLEENDFRVWPLERVIDHLQSGDSIPDRTVAITIDDAFRSVYDEAYPRLRERGWPFTVFVATEDVDKDADWSLSWDQVREMAANGATIANHTHTHAYLVRKPEGVSKSAWMAQAEEDITRARERLETELEDPPPPFFAYPFGEYSLELAELVQELGYEAAFGQHSGVLGRHSDHRALPRFALNERYGDIDAFSQRVESRHFPVTGITPWDPVLGANNPPELKVTYEGGPEVAAVNCFVSDQGQVAVEPEGDRPRQFAVKAPEALPQGRSRYNCTAPSGEAGRFYWFSQQWLVQ